MIEGTLVAGIGGATRTVGYQLPYFQKMGLPDAELLQAGTLNVDLSPAAWDSLTFDYFFQDIPNGNEELEDFGFIAIDELDYEGARYTRPGYIYVPHRSPHVANQQQLELITVPLNNKQDDKIILLSLAAGKIVMK